MGIWQKRAQLVNSKSMSTTNDIQYDFLTDLNMGYKLTINRDLMINERIKGVNVGQEISRNQDINSNYNPFYLTKVLPTQINANANYTQTRKNFIKENSENAHNYDGRSSRSILTTTILQNSTFFTYIANKFGAKIDRNISNEKDDGNGRSLDDGNLSSRRQMTGDVANELRIGRSATSRIEGTDDLLGRGIFTQDQNEDNLFKDNDLYNNDEPDNENEQEDEEKEEDEKDNTPETNGRERDRRLSRGFRDKDISPFEKDNEITQKDDNKQSQSKPNNLSNSIFANLFGFLAKVQNFNITHKNTYSTSYSSSPDAPDFLYQLGLPYTLDSKYIQPKSINDDYSVSTGLPIIRNLSTDLRFAYTLSRDYMTSSKAKNTTTTWPDIRMSYTGFERLIRLDKWLTSSRVQTGYILTTSRRYDANSWSKPISENQNHSFSPIFGWNGNWVNNFTTGVSVNYSQSIAKTMSQITSSSKTANKTNYTANLGYSLSTDQGIKLPFVKKKIYFSNQIQLDVAFSYEMDDSYTTNNDKKKIVESENVRMSVSPRVSYNFSRNIKGGLSGTYDETEDKRSKNKTNRIGLDFWAEVTF
jgi:hypothetical protein